MAWKWCGDALLLLLVLVAADAQYDPQARKGGGVGRGKGRQKPDGISASIRQANAVTTHGPLGALRPFVYNHVAKTGGSFVKNMLLGLFPREDLTIVEEWQGLQELGFDKTGPRRPFVMGAIRAPCDYYLSLWSFTSGGTMDRVVRTVPESFQFHGQDEAEGYNTPADIERFRQWIRAIASEHSNLLTNRFWFSYFKSGNPCLPREGDVCAGPNSKFETMLMEINANLTSVGSLSDVADCWLRTEHLEADLEKCLYQYSAEAGVPIDWEFFHKMRRQKEKNSSGRKGSCQDFYDDETRQLVMTTDKHVVRLFGYEGCCASETIKSEL
eukprot:TRINITY_DN94480_c0_g1_i1.p1 TRINITY_DN94480_c0_g1~~TRINITY_DN94480_c0_g1_i1.p1  ORF type:complete len:327 (-),score=38.04 TRINITY_DN94480_c0_g1_i1:55-1035(-)